MPESNFAERSVRSKEQVSGAKVITQALKRQVQSTSLKKKSPTVAGRGRGVVLETRSVVGVGLWKVPFLFALGEREACGYTVRGRKFYSLFS